MTYYRQRTQGYKSLKSYQMSEIVFDATYKFCMRFLRKDWRTTDQMVQAARSGKQNIAEGCMGASVSGAFELKLICVARTSLEELLIDYHDFLRLRDLKIWNKYDEYAKEVRNLAYLSNRSYKTYKCYIENENSEVAANTIICLIHQTNFLLDRQKLALTK